ncbi:hypothetical protein TNCV_3348551 [Trichonephila clavipes]|nr:hypothetical protein TNCV_3348551 [Trichonephila clavipes]
MSSCQSLRGKNHSDDGSRLVSAPRVTRHLGCSDFTIRRCWNQWTREMSATGQLSLGCSQQSNNREDRHIIRHTRIAQTVSLAVIHTQAGSLRRTSVSLHASQGA